MSAASGALTSAPASTGATKAVGTCKGIFDAWVGTSPCPPQPLPSVSRRTSACIEDKEVGDECAVAGKIRFFEVDRPQFIFDRMLVRSGDTLPDLA